MMSGCRCFEIDQHTSLVDRLRPQLVQSIAVTELMLHKHRYDAPHEADLHLSTLMQQTLSIIAERGGATAEDLYANLCRSGPFTNVPADMFALLLRDMGHARLLEQAGDGLLLHGSEGERLVHHHSFYAAFRSPVEYIVLSQGRQLGTLPLPGRLHPGDFLIFSGRRWFVDSIDESTRTVELKPAHGGRPPSFGGEAIPVADTVRRQMRHVLHDDTEPAYLNDVAAQLLHEGRSSYRQLGLTEQQVVGDTSETVILPWRGDRVLTTMTLMLRRHGVAAAHYGAAVVVRDTAPTELHGVLAEIAAEPAPDPTLLAAPADGKQSDKYDRYLSVPLLNRAYASRHLDVPEAHRTIQGLAG